MIQGRPWKRFRSERPPHQPQHQVRSKSSRLARRLRFVCCTAAGNRGPPVRSSMARSLLSSECQDCRINTLLPERPCRLRRRSGVRSEAAQVAGVQGALFCLAPPVPVWHPSGRPGDGGAGSPPPRTAACRRCRPRWSEGRGPGRSPGSSCRLPRSGRELSAHLHSVGVSAPQPRRPRFDAKSRIMGP